MADPNDVRGTKVARTELSKRGIDISRCDLRVKHGNLHIKGQIGALKGSMIKDLKTEMELISRVLKQRSEIRDVILDCNYRDSAL